MGDKKNRTILSAEAEFPRDLIDAFLKPMRKNVQPIELGSIIELEPAQSSQKTENLRCLVVGLSQSSQEMLITPIHEFTGSYTSKIMDYDCIVSDKASIAQMGYEHAVVINVSKTQTLKLKDNQITDNDNYLLVSKDADYPLVRATAKAPQNVTNEAQRSLSDYVFELQSRIERKPRMSDAIHCKNAQSALRELPDFGLPEVGLN